MWKALIDIMLANTIAIAAMAPPESPASSPEKSFPVQCLEINGKKCPPTSPAQSASGISGTPGVQK